MKAGFACCAQRARRFAVQVGTALWLAVAFTLQPAAADFDREVVAQSHVGVNVYSDRERVRVATGIVVGPETVLTDAQVTARGQRHAVVLASGAEITATVTQTDNHSSLAVLNVPGLDAPPIALAQQEVSADEDRFVFAAAIDPEGGTTGAAIVVSTGSVSRVAEFASPRTGAALSLYEHNVPLAAVGFGGSLLNNCGELIGVNRPSPDGGGWFADVLQDPQGVAFANRLSGVQAQLDAWGVAYRKSGSDCLTEAESAALRATERAQEAEAAQRALNEALAREREIAESAEAAKQAGEEFQAEAEAAQRAAGEATAALEEATAAVEAAQARHQEAEAAAEAAQQEAEAESAQLRDDLQKANEATAQLQASSSRNLRIAVIGGAGLLALAILLFALRSRQRNRQLALQQEKAEQAESDLETAMRQSDFPDCLFEGTDHQGSKIALKIPGASLSATVDGVTIGRNPDRATFVIDSPSVSRIHCRLKFDGDSLTISDLNSSNGVLVNDAKLVGEESKLLRPGDRVTLGDVELTLRTL